MQNHRTAALEWGRPFVRPRACLANVQIAGPTRKADFDWWSREYLDKTAIRTRAESGTLYRAGSPACIASCSGGSDLWPRHHPGIGPSRISPRPRHDLSASAWHGKARMVARQLAVCGEPETQDLCGNRGWAQGAERGAGAGPPAIRRDVRRRRQLGPVP